MMKTKLSTNRAFVWRDGRSCVLSSRHGGIVLEAALGLTLVFAAIGAISHSIGAAAQVRRIQAKQLKAAAAVSNALEQLARENGIPSDEAAAALIAACPAEFQMSIDLAKQEVGGIEGVRADIKLRNAGSARQPLASVSGWFPEEESTNDSGDSNAGGSQEKPSDSGDESAAQDAPESANDGGEDAS